MKMTEAERSAIAGTCAALVTNFCHAADQADGGAAAALFAPDGEWISGRKQVVGRAALSQHFADRKPGLVVRHLTGPTSVRVDRSDHASAVTYYAVFTGETAEDGRPAPLQLPFSMGEWHDRLVRLPEGWRIARHEVKRLLQRPTG
jgi:uncharacterized protein (TIGR02246 family)